MKTNCLRCRKSIRWPEAFCSAECRSLGATAPPVPASLPLTVMRRRTMSVREAEAMASELRTPDATRRAMAQQEDDMLIRASALRPHRPA